MSDLIPTMIVEDEKFILEGLLSIVNWEKEGFKIVATAINGEMGVKKFEQYHPELILTDIKMPVLDGISMMKSIRLQSPSTQFFVISAYSDFEYAQDALRLGALDYILKPSISENYIREKLMQFKQRNSSQKTMYLAVFQKALSDCVTSDLAIDENEFDTFFLGINQNINKQSIPAYIDAALEVFESRIHEKNLDIDMEKPSVLSLEDLKIWLFQQISKIQQTTLMYTEQNLSPIVISAYNYMKEHFHNPDLQISDIADAVAISSSRLSVLFKSETGKTINEILTEIRINEAKYLLQWKKLKVYEVSERVGYKTSQYFSKVFYKYTGQYPNYYREID